MINQPFSQENQLMPLHFLQAHLFQPFPLDGNGVNLWGPATLLPQSEITCVDLTQKSVISEANVTSFCQDASSCL